MKALGSFGWLTFIHVQCLCPKQHVQDDSTLTVQGETCYKKIINTPKRQSQTLLLFHIRQHPVYQGTMQMKNFLYQGFELLGWYKMCRHPIILVLKTISLHPLIEEHQALFNQLQTRT